MAAPAVTTGAVAGTGTMGTGFAQLLALAGLTCRVADATPELAAAGRERAVEGARRFAAAGLMGPEAPDLVAERVTAVGSPEEAADGADVVFEAAPEEPGLKRRLLAAIEAAAGPDCVVATNTSAIPIRDLSVAFRSPERFLGTHWFNPPQWVPCVEVIPGPQTAPVHLEAMQALLLRMGKEPVRVGDAAGFVANRIQFAMFKEAASVVADGVASAEEVDAVVRSSFGFRLPFFGPFAIADMAGLDVYAGAYAALEADLGERFAVPDAVRDRVQRGELGVKSGGGFLPTAVEETEAMIAWRDASYAALARLLEDRGGWRAP